MNRDPERHIWYVLVATAALMAASGIVRPVLGQSAPNSVAYLQQLAVVVDGNSGGGFVWVVMCGATAPYEVIGTYTTAAQASEALSTARATGKTCWLDGPYRTDRSFDGNMTTYGAVCKKGPDSQCLSDTSAVFLSADVRLVTMTTYLSGGRTVVDSFRPQSVEAIFFTMSAVDKMLIPYYLRVYGPAYAQRQQQLLARRARVLNP